MSGTAQHLASQSDMSAYAIPIAPRRELVLWGRFPLSEAEWWQMMQVLNAMRLGLVRPQPGKGWNQP